MRRDLKVMDPDFDETSLRVSRWDQAGAEYVRSNEEWCSRFARRMASLRRDVSLDEALQVAQEVSLEDELRALAPEYAADDLLARDLPLGE